MTNTRPNTLVCINWRWELLENLAFIRSYYHSIKTLIYGNILKNNNSAQYLQNLLIFPVSVSLTLTFKVPGIKDSTTYSLI